MSQTVAKKKSGIARFFEGIAEFFTSPFKAFVEGDIFVKLSALLCGASCFARKQYLKGFSACWKPPSSSSSPPSSSPT